ncbi:Transcriptional repressor CTCF [Armadillidium vulgare]|nr:Transcriptional repressor CTCF [Armadillidium vulgare]
MFTNSSSSKSDFLEYSTVEKPLNNDLEDCQKSSSRFFTCSYCDYSSSAKANVKRHVMFKHTGEKNAQCSFCERWFTTNEQLKLHIRVHTGDKPYQCSYCPLKYTQSCHLTRHVLKKHKLPN